MPIRLSAGFVPMSERQKMTEQDQDSILVLPLTNTSAQTIHFRPG